MLLQTNSYIVPKEKRAEHARLLARFRQTLARLGCDHFESFEQVGANWSGGDTTGRFVQIMRFRDRKQQQQVQQAERTDPQAQALIKEFCELINFPYQQQQGLFAVGFYSSVMAVAPTRAPGSVEDAAAVDLPKAATESAEPAEPGDRAEATDPPNASPRNGEPMGLSALSELPALSDDTELSDDIAPDDIVPGETASGDIPPADIVPADDERESTKRSTASPETVGSKPAGGI